MHLFTGDTAKEICNTGTAVIKNRISAVQKTTWTRLQKQDVNNNQHRTVSSKPGFFQPPNPPRFQVLTSGALGQFPSQGSPGSTNPSAAPAPGAEVFPANSQNPSEFWTENCLGIGGTSPKSQGGSQSPSVNQKIVIKHDQQKHSNTFGHPKSWQSISKLSQQTSTTPKSHGAGMLLPTARALGRKLLPTWDSTRGQKSHDKPGSFHHPMMELADNTTIIKELHHI